jgi:hypothetical protein
MLLRMRWWLIDPSGLLHRILLLVSSLDEAASFVGYYAESGQVVTDGTTGLFLGSNDIAAIFSFAFEEAAGVDLKERYRWFGATPGEHGVAIQQAARAAPVDRGWADRLAAVGLAIVPRHAAGRSAKGRWAIEISDEDI